MRLPHIRPYPMKNTSNRIAAMAICLSLAGCGGLNVWPFGGGEKYQDRSKAPANATAYQCDSGKRFHVRTLEDGAAVWLILPDREVRLSKVSEARYSNGIAVLELSGGNATLADGSATGLKGCKAATPS
jgi:membrane-bound inhibitor of C-type lysozyme